MKRWVVRVAWAAAFAVVGWAGQVPRPAPALSVLTPSGQKISLAEYKGKVVLLKFFLTECPHCQRSAGHIQPIYQEWRSRGLEVLGVAINPDAKTAIPEFARRFHVSYPMGTGDLLMLTTFASLVAVARAYVPYMFLIDRKGTIRFEHPGEDRAFYSYEEQNLRAELDFLLKETGSGAARKVSSTRKAVPKSE